MIISHKHKFIFIKPTKVAGTSVQVALIKHCGSGDVITKTNGRSESSDDNKYIGPGQNNENWQNAHITPEEIKKKIGLKIWDDYYKFTIVRNPWDLLISKYFWNVWLWKKKIKETNNKELIKNIFSFKKFKTTLRIFKRKIFKEKSVSKFLKTFPKKSTNEKYYFDKKGKPICDFYIRYENLEEDYKKVCEHLGIPYEKLPRLKTKQRTEKKHYSTYYDEKAKNRIGKIYKKEIEYFNYKFEETNDNIS